MCVRRDRHRNRHIERVSERSLLTREKNNSDGDDISKLVDEREMIPHEGVESDAILQAQVYHHFVHGETNKRRK